MSECSAFCHHRQRRLRRDHICSAGVQNCFSWQTQVIQDACTYSTPSCSHLVEVCHLCKGIHGERFLLRVHALQRCAERCFSGRDGCARRIPAQVAQLQHSLSREQLSSLGLLYELQHVATPAFPLGQFQLLQAQNFICKIEEPKAYHISSCTCLSCSPASSDSFKIWCIPLASCYNMRDSCRRFPHLLG